MDNITNLKKTKGSESERTINKGQTIKSPSKTEWQKHKTSEQSDELCVEDRTNKNKTNVCDNVENKITNIKEETKTRSISKDSHLYECIKQTQSRRRVTTFRPFSYETYFTFRIWFYGFLNNNNKYHYCDHYHHHHHLHRSNNNNKRRWKASRRNHYRSKETKEHLIITKFHLSNERVFSEHEPNKKRCKKRGVKMSVQNSRKTRTKQSNTEGERLSISKSK